MLQKLLSAIVCFALMAIVAPLSSAQAADASAKAIITQGQSRYTIVHDKDATAAEQMAAKELQDVLKQMTGVTLPIKTDSADLAGPLMVVGLGDRATQWLGQEAIAGLARDELVVKTVGEHLLLAGHRPMGSLYAVYDFLERDLGCRWMSMFEGDIIPQRDTVALPEVDRRDKPAFVMRDFFMFYGWHANYPAVERFFYRNRAIGPRLLTEYRRGKYPFVGELEHTFPYRFSKTGFGHTFFKLVDPKEHFEQHPDWFSMVNGKRQARQLCFTNPGLRDAMTKAVLAKIAEDPELLVGNMIHLGAQDDFTGLCTCPDCLAMVEREGGAVGAPLYDYMAELGRILEKDYPTALVSTLAYRKTQTEKPPQHIVFPDNILIVFAAIDNDFSKSFIHPNNADARKNITDWTRKVKHVWLWYYPNHYGRDMLPIGNFQNMVEDMRLFQEIGVKGFWHEHDAAITDFHLFFDLQSWLMTKLMWNPQQDLDALITEYTDLHYGPAAPFIRQYIAKLEDATRSLKNRMGWHGPLSDFTYITPKLVNDSQKLFDEAVKAVEGDDVRTLRVQQVRMSLDRASLIRWPKISELPGFNGQLETVINRYEDTWDKTIAQRLQTWRAKAKTNMVKDWIKDVTARHGIDPASHPIPSVRVPRVPSLQGDGTKAAWGKGVLINQWHTLMGSPRTEPMEARMLHDGEHLYIRLTDRTPKEKIVNSLWSGDVWEVFVSPWRDSFNVLPRDSSLPYRQMALMPDVHFTFCYSRHLQQVENVWDHVTVKSEKLDDRWVVTVAVPLKDLTPNEGVSPGGKFYLNFYRSKPGVGALAWSPNFDRQFHVLSRMAQCVLEE